MFFSKFSMFGLFSNKLILSLNKVNLLIFHFHLPIFFKVNKFSRKYISVLTDLYFFDFQNENNFLKPPLRISKLLPRNRG